MEIEPPLDIGYLVQLHNKNPDVFYMTIMDLDVDDLVSLCKANKELNNLICHGKGRNIWKLLWKKNLSEEIPNIPIGELRRLYIKAMTDVKKYTSSIAILIYAAEYGFENLIQKYIPGIDSTVFLKLLETAILSNNENVVNELLKPINFSKYRQEFDRESKTFLRDAIKIGNLDIINYLILAGAPLNDYTRGVPPLTLAVKNGNIDVVRLLLEKGFTEGLRPPYNGYYPALLIAIKTDMDIARLLVEYGADIPSAIALADFPKERAILQDLSLEKSDQVYF